MLEKVPNKKSPCIQKKCGFCCDPVAISKKQIDTLGKEKLPKGVDGVDLFIKNNEVLISEEHPDTQKFYTFTCKNFDKETKICKDYDNRPNLCRNTTCIQDKNKDIDTQYEEFTKRRFIKINKK